MFARLGTDYEIRNQWFFAILEAMTTGWDLSQWKCYDQLQCMVCVCVCVFFPFILDIKGRTSRGHTGGRPHRTFNPPSFCGACLDFCREKDSAIPFPRRPWSRILCTNELIVLHPLGIFILVLVFSEKNPVCRDRTHVPTCQKVTRCRLSYRGRPAHLY